MVARRLPRTRDYLTTRRVARRIRNAARPLRCLFHETAQLGNWLRVVVDLKAQQDIVMQPDAAALLHDEKRGALFPSRVTTRRLPCLECGNETERECALRRDSEHVPLHRHVRALSIACPWRRTRTCVRGHVALRIDHRELAPELP